MSEQGVHTHAPHEDMLHHPAAPGLKRLNQWIALFTAVLAALGALVSYEGSLLMEEVLLAKNEAVLEKAHATDDWNYYQAASTKQHLTEIARDLAPASRRAELDTRIAKYRAQKQELAAKARRLDAASARSDARSASLSRPHTAILRSIIALQVAISLASITALTGRRWLFAGALVSAFVGVGLWLGALGWHSLG
ncbi:MAG: DUF4337 domain-containing protein [Gammaproteobacteria bacterium]|nr:DUF4337 domain-containing protein [Gammaproteobacteria bacterium]